MWDLIVSVPDHCLSFYSVYSNLQIVLPYYIKGDRKLSVIHARLRNNCSNL